MACKIPLTNNQFKYINSLTNQLKAITIGVGPAGTGKTMFACQTAANALYEKKCGKIVLTRPIVAVDEMMGYLPGTIDDKMNPWTRPMFDVFENYFTATRMKQLLTDKTIEIAPLGFMRGRTLSNTFIVADEMQNSTTNQMKMLLTRIGENSKMVLTGDLEQCDLPPSTMNGLVDIVTRVQSYDRQLQYIDLVVMDHHDIQRHPTVSEILEVYKKQD